MTALLGALESIRSGTTTLVENASGIGADAGPLCPRRPLERRGWPGASGGGLPRCTVQVKAPVTRTVRLSPGFDYIALLYASVYGPRQHCEGLYPRLMMQSLDRMAKGRPHRFRPTHHRRGAGSNLHRSGQSRDVDKNSCQPQGSRWCPTAGFWRPETNLETGLRQLIACYRQTRLGRQEGSMTSSSIKGNTSTGTVTLANSAMQSRIIPLAATTQDIYFKVLLGHRCSVVTIGYACGSGDMIGTPQRPDKPQRLDTPFYPCPTRIRFV